LAWYARSGDHFLRYQFAGRFVDGGSVLDIGCGHGFGGLALKGVANRYVGIDIDTKAIEWAQRNIETRAPWTQFHSIQSIHDALDWEDCDLALAFELIEHLNRPQSLLTVLGRIVGEGGRGLLSTPNGANSHGDPDLYVSPYHVHEFSLRELLQLLQSCALTGKIFVEYRLDGLDLIGRRALGRPLGRSLQSSPTSIRNSFLGKVNDFWNDRLNGPSFWKIAPLNVKRPPFRPYSTFIVGFDEFSNEFEARSRVDSFKIGKGKKF